jgi:hypothetical protein
MHIVNTRSAGKFRFPVGPDPSPLAGAEKIGLVFGREESALGGRKEVEAGLIGIRRTAIAALAALPMVASGFAFATTYYVSNSGNDSNSGTSPQYPWKTITRVNSQQYAPGDTILFFGGQSFSGNVVLESSGTAGSPVTVGSYGTQAATISAGTGSGIYWHDSGGAIVEDLVVQGSGSGSNQSNGINFYARSGAYSAITVSNVSVSGFREGVYFGTVNGTYSNVVIADVTAYDNGDTGVFIDNSKSWPTPEMSNLTIRSSSAYGNGRWGVQIEGVKGGTVEKSAAYDNGDIGMWSWAANAILFQQDVAYENGGKDGGFDLDVGTTNSTIQYSYSYDNGGSGFQVCNYAYNPDTANNTIRFNIAENNYGSADGLELDGDGSMIHGLYYYNNTIYSNTAGGDYHIAEYTPASSFVVANNIVYAGNDGTSASLWAADPMTLDYDDWYGALGDFWYDDTAYGSYESFRNATGKEANGRNIYPVFVGAPGSENSLVYRLAPGAPLFGAGADMRKAYHIDPGLRDYFGNLLPRNGALSIGADEGRTAGKRER